MLTLEEVVFAVAEAEGDGGPRERRILDGIDYAFARGKFYAITGPNGSGKTTLAKCIMGINPVTSGRIVFAGQDVTQTSISERARAGIAYSFQHPARFKGITFRDLLTIAMGSDEEKAVGILLRRVGICSFSFLDKPVDAKLSGGEIKKIELATTIARNPKLAIYDEPDTGIDLWTIGPMVELLKREQREAGATTIVVSHNRAFLEAADEILLLNRGRIAYAGDLAGAIPLLTDLSVCDYPCGDDDDARCFR